MENYKYLYEQTKLIVEKYQDEIVPRLREQLKRAEWGLDAAVEDINDIAKRDGNAWMCRYCANCKGTHGVIADCRLKIGECQRPYTKFEWRGPQKEE